MQQKKQQLEDNKLEEKEISMESESVQAKCHSMKNSLASLLKENKWIKGQKQ
jgi:hypothetical protein